MFGLGLASTFDFRTPTSDQLIFRYRFIFVPNVKLSCRMVSNGLNLKSYHNITVTSVL